MQGAGNSSPLNSLKAAVADPLTDILAPAATSLTCTEPEDEAVEAKPELNPGHILAGSSAANQHDPLQQPPMQRMVQPSRFPNTSLERRASELQSSSSSSVGEDRVSSGVAVGVSGRQTSINIRTQQFKEVLSQDAINLQRLRKLAYHGIPDRDGLRATAWKLLLNYLPPDKKLWSKVLEDKRQAYKVFCQELIVDPKQAGMAVRNDHPLNLNNDSRWNAFFKDAEMLEQIDRDVMRTHPDMHFFSGTDGAAVQHREEMKRALFVFAKLNQGLRYVQGMNELFAPLYYQFRNDIEASESPHAEADAFYCFMDIIAEFRDHFCQQLDNSKVGIRATLSKLSELLHEKDEELWTHVQINNKVNPQFYAFRWITLLLTQEFPFPDSVRLWDTLFSDSDGRYNCLLRFCCAMLVNVREELLKGDFAQNLKMLQKYPPVDVHSILHKAAYL